MTRIATHGSNQMYLSRILEVQKRVHESQVQVSTEKKSLVYSGIARDTNRLINFENEVASAELYIQNNSMADTRTRAATTAVDSAMNAIKNFKKTLDEFSSGDIKNQAKIETLQKAAFEAMGEVRNYLSTTVDGQYLFSGGRVNTPPVELPADSLAQFQQLYDGMAHTYPTTRESHLLDTQLTSKQMGSLTMNFQGGFLLPATNGAFAGMPAGARVTLAGTTGSDNDYTVRGHVGMNVEGEALTETADAGATTFITYNHGKSILDNTATGALSFAFAPSGDMVVDSTIPNALSGLQEGAKFTVKGSTDVDGDGNGDWDGAFVVVSSADGKLTITNDTDVGKPETVDASALKLYRDVAVVDGQPDTLAAHGLATGTPVPLTISGNTITMDLGVDMSASFAPGDAITIVGTENHNGTYRVTNVTATGIEFAVNPDAIRVSQFVPQTGRDDITVKWQGHTPLDATDYGTLDFTLTGLGGESITAATPNAFTQNGIPDPPAGSIFTLDSTSGVNDGTYKVVSNDGTTIVIESTILADDGAGLNEVAASATVSASSWYKGDTLGIEHRVDNNWSVDMGVFASHPGFEKALRAMGLIAQGEYGTAGGLENNGDRVASARYLLGDALESTSSNDGPLGPEDHDDILGLQAQLGMLRKTLTDVNSKHKDYVGFLQTRITDIVHVDKTEAVTRLLDDQAALEAGYQALAKVRGQSLLDFLR